MRARGGPARLPQWHEAAKADEADRPSGVDPLAGDAGHAGGASGMGLDNWCLATSAGCWANAADDLPGRGRHAAAARGWGPSCTGPGCRAAPCPGSARRCVTVARIPDPVECPSAFSTSSGMPRGTILWCASRERGPGPPRRISVKSIWQTRGNRVHWIGADSLRAVNLQER